MPRCAMRIETSGPERVREAMELAAGLGLRVDDKAHLRGRPLQDELILAMRPDGLELRDTAMKPGKGLRIDLTHLARRRGAANLSRRQPLARAMGRGTRLVIDATAGLGHDAALLAAMGFHVTAIERDAILAALLTDALQRAAADAATANLLANNLRVVHAEARDVLARGDVPADCIYIDPMFPPKRRASALAKKEIRLVRALVGDDDDAAELLAAARQQARRVVVKRPTYAPPLAENPSAQIAGKLVRYDMYLR